MGPIKARAPLIIWGAKSPMVPLASPSVRHVAGALGSAKKSSVCSPRNHVTSPIAPSAIKLARELAGGGADIVEPRHANLASSGFDHSATVFKRGAKGFLTEHRLVQRKRSFSDITVQFLWGGDHYGFDLWIVDENVPVVRCALRTRTLCGISQRFEQSWRRSFPVGAQLRIKNSAHSGHSDSMGFAHIAAANDTNADFCHRAVLSVK